MPGLTSALHWFTKDARCLASLSIAYGDGHHVKMGVSGNMREQTGLDSQSMDVPATIDTIFDLASLTKLFTAISIMQLADRGKLSLKDPVGKHAPQFRRIWDVTVGEVLSYQVCLKTPKRLQGEAEEAQQLLLDVQAFPHATGRMYSDIHAMVLKYVVEGAGGRGFFEYIQQHILRPAGMRDTYAAVPKSAYYRTACFNFEHRIEGDAYTLRRDTPIGVPHDPKARILSQNGKDLCGHAGLFSTLPDMAKLCQALLNETLLQKESLLQMSVDRTGSMLPNERCQRLGYLCFVKDPIQHHSEIPRHMSSQAIGLSGFTGHHLSIDPITGVFEVFLGNRCLNRLSICLPLSSREALGLNLDGTGQVLWPDGRHVYSSVDYIYQKDVRLHSLIARELGGVAPLTTT